MSNASTSVELRDKTTLKKALGPLQLWAIGVGIVISGDYFGWNFGMSTGGLIGMAIATLLMAIMYTTMVFTIAELSTMLPHAGGPYSFARRTMGPLAGFLTGIGVVLEYSLAAPVIAIGMGGYINFLFPSAPPVLGALIVYIIFIAIHVWGIKEYAAIETIIVLIALGMLVIFYIIGLPQVSYTNLFGGLNGNLLPSGVFGIWACIPYAMWLYLAVEMLPMMAEECRNPVKDMPKGLKSSMLTLLILSGLTVFIATGLAGWKEISDAGDPLPFAVAAALGKNHWLAQLLGTVGLAGLLASFSGVLLAYSRQVFALSRAGYLPSFLSKLHRTRRTPYWALIVPGVIGLILVKTVGADYIILVATFGALISYITMNLSCIVLRKKDPKAERPYKVPLYPLTPAISIILAFLALFASIFYAWQWFLVCIGIFIVAIIYYYAWARHRINPSAPEEEAAILAAQAELDGVN